MGQHPQQYFSWSSGMTFVLPTLVGMIWFKSNLWYSYLSLTECSGNSTSYSQEISNEKRIGKALLSCDLGGRVHLPLEQRRFKRETNISLLIFQRERKNVIYNGYYISFCEKEIFSTSRFHF